MVRTALPYIAFGLVLFALMESAQAASYLGDEWYKHLGGLRTFGQNDQSGEELAINFVRNLVRIFRYVIGAAALIVATIYGVLLVTAAGKEDRIQKQRTALIWLGVGFVILIIAENVAVLLQPEQAESKALINFDAANDQLRSIVNYLKYLLGSILLVAMLVSGVRLITAKGEEEKITKEKRHLTYSGIGMLVVMLADNIVDAVYIVQEPGEVTVGDATTTIGEIAGVIRLLLAFLGPVAVGMTILAGFYYLTALGNDEKTQKARRLITASLTGIIVIYAAGAIVNTIIKGQLPVS